MHCYYKVISRLNAYRIKLLSLTMTAAITTLVPYIASSISIPGPVEEPQEPPANFVRSSDLTSQGVFSEEQQTACRYFEQRNISATTHFQLSYDPIEEPLTITDYEDALEAIYAKAIVEYGWGEPPLCTTDSPNPETHPNKHACSEVNPWSKYPVVISSLGDDEYGYIETGGGHPSIGPIGWLGDNPNTEAVETGSEATCLVLNSDYSWAADQTPLEVLRSTVAHEYIHAIQFGLGDPNSGEDRMWYESTAAYFEQEFEDNANTNHLFLYPSMGTVSEISFSGDPVSYPACQGQYGGWRAQYENWPFLQHVAENFGGANVGDPTNIETAGENIIYYIWENIAQGQRGLTALQNALGGAEVLQTEYHNFAIATALMLDDGKGCSDGYEKPYCMEEGELMATYEGKTNNPKPGPNGFVMSISGTYDGSLADHYTANYVKLSVPEQNQLVDIEVSAAQCSSVRLRASLVCDVGTALAVMPFNDILSAGQSTTLRNEEIEAQQPLSSCQSLYIVVTNEADSGAEVSECPTCGYKIYVKKHLPLKTMLPVTF